MAEPEIVLPDDEHDEDEDDKILIAISGLSAVLCTAIINQENED